MAIIGQASVTVVTPEQREAAEKAVYKARWVDGAKGTRIVSDADLVDAVLNALGEVK